MKKFTTRQIIVLFALLAMIAVNFMANALPINGQTTAEISDRFEVFFVPAGYVFSIWGLIYLGLLGYAIYQLQPSQATSPALREIGTLFVLSSAANIAWIFLWHYEFFTLTVLVMIVLLGVLISIYLRLKIGRSQVTRTMLWFVHVPFRIYLGWITVATIANITSLLHYLDWSGWGISPELWTLIMLGAAVIIGAVNSLNRGDVAFAAVLVWAFVGIASKHDDTEIVATGAWISAGITTLMMVVGVYWHRTQTRHLSLAA